MNQEKNIHYLIEGYLQQNLSPEELKAFEEKLVTDADLPEKVEIARLAQIATIRNKFYQVEGIVAGIKNQEKLAQKRKMVLLASGLALLIAGGVI